MHAELSVFQVGCDGHLWKHHTQLVQQLKQQARDGTLAEVLQQPVIGWHIKTEASSSHRERREVVVSKLATGRRTLLPRNIIFVLLVLISVRG
jgi:hypothetical protein